jgi:glutathione synthase/RimK-type ligase-like ATP-grasp enzyme
MKTAHILIDSPGVLMDLINEIHRQMPETTMVKFDQKRGRWPLFAKRTDMLINWAAVTRYPVSSRQVKVLNECSARLKGTNKAVGRALMMLKGVPVPESYWRKDDIKYPCIARKEFHSGSKGFYICNNETELVGDDKYWYYQEIYPNVDQYRCYVMGGEVRLTLQYYPYDGDLKRLLFVNNTVKPVDPPQAVKDACIKAVDCLGLDFGSVDVMTNFNHSKPVAVCEVNTSGEMRGQKIIADAYVKYFREELRK